MPRIFDNIALPLLPTLKATLNESTRADFCVGYFNLRGWKHLDQYVEKYSGENGAVCRLMVGMQKAPADELRDALSLLRDDAPMDQQSAVRLKEKMAQEFREQLTVGAPTNDDEAALRRLAKQIHDGKLVVKLFLKHTLHAKLYLCYRNDINNPATGFVGSSNLTFSGLQHQGELNVDVLEHDATDKLSKWFEARWCERFCLDISKELADIIETSWAREVPIPPYHIYLKMAYHLSQEARAGLAEFSIPRNMRTVLLPFQAAAVKIAARHIDKRGGVVIGDVVGLGKTLMATALAKMFDELHMEVLVLCPKNLVKMWEGYFHRYEVRGRVMSVTQAIKTLPALDRFRVVLIDESHNLRNRDGKVYGAVRAYFEKNESKCILLTATPYNKTYLDLSNQLRLFVPDNRDLGVRPEQYLKFLAQVSKLPGEIEFARRHTGSPKSLSAFEKSEYPDDWRELLRLYMVRRTRSFIADNYGILDTQTNRRYLEFADKTRSYFPARVPKTVKFKADTQFELLYSPDVVRTINALALPRYGLGNYAAQKPSKPATPAEKKQLDDLSRAGKRLMGFCRTNLFKRLESSGMAFLLSVERHLLRNFVFLHALENGLLLPIGTQNADMLDTRNEDADTDTAKVEIEYDQGDENADTADLTPETPKTPHPAPDDEETYRKRAETVYKLYATRDKKRFKWVPSHLFTPLLAKHLRSDADALFEVLHRCNEWEAGKDEKLAALRDLVAREHPGDKVLVFTQFADTANYLAEQLTHRGVDSVGCATGQSADPTELAWRFSPRSNDKEAAYPPENRVRVLIATDVLSEGQNLQDSRIVVNYDLPWAIIRLIQRAGRVDRIGQQAEQILCYSFLPADGVEAVINLRSKVQERLKENAEVVGTDEAFFEDDTQGGGLLHDLYNEKAGVLDGDDDQEVDLASYAFQIWNNATKNNPALKKQIEEMPNVVYSAKTHIAAPDAPHGALLFLRTAEGTDALAYVDKEGNSVTEAQFAILRSAQCEPTTPAAPRHPSHHESVARAIEHIRRTDSAEGTLGRPTGARYRTYDLLKQHVAKVRGTLLDNPELEKATEELLKFPLTQTATDTLNVHLRGGDTAERIAELVLHLRDENRLTIQTDDAVQREPRILCSMGLVAPPTNTAVTDPREGLFGTQTMLVMPPS